ncbi:DUF937 domain-containing protein [Dokdonella koreensis]|uniref:Calcium-binding EF-hand-containing protein n=1 Tax=Dokdonella koreensis DS-123 TaxID=1300342 RepID=A0A161HRL3_9GAMM|nr:DUF937 domain-containing protein [Dokdonella koreensis]ANB18922.1 Calcium-binding EF-hand-containing protein [Dokdonella koreensis DS-123]
MNTRDVDLIGQVMSQLGPSDLGAIAQQLGVSEDRAGTAVEQALPLLLGGLARNAATDDGASALFGAVNRDHQGLDLGSVLGSVLGGGGQGGGILGHIFGGRQPQAAQGLGQVSGLGTQNAAQLLAMLAPLVMAALGRATRDQQLDAGGLGGLLGQQAPQAARQGGAGDLVSAVLDRNGDGEVDLGELLQAGSGLLGAFGRR